MTSLAPAIRRTSASLAAPTWRDALPVAIGMSLLFVTLYSACNLITSHRGHVGTWAFAWEKRIPLVPWMMVPYVSIDLLFFFSFFVCTSFEELRAHAKRIGAANVIAAACFLLFPLTMDVRRVMPTGPYAPLFRFMYGFDLPYNLVPSLHIAQGILLWVIYARHTRGGVRCLLALWFLLVGVSTLFTWQHRTPDLITGAMLGVLCLYLFPERVDDRQDGERPARNPAVGARWGVAAALLVILAWLIGGWGWLLLWPAFSAGAVAFAYVAGGPRVFCKHAGRLPMPTRLVLLPTLLAGHVAWRHLRRPSRPWVQVLPNLYIGRRLNNREALALRQEGVAAVLDLTAECSECRELLRVPYLNLPLLDLTVPTAGQFDEAVRFIREGVGSGGVYVHCALGYSRAAVVVCAYLLAEGLSSDPVSAIAVVRGVRPQIVLKEDSLEALRNYASKIVKQQWVPLAASRIGNAR